MAEGVEAPTSDRGEQAARISREMVSLMRRISGRGPTRARTTIGRDHVLVMFEDMLTEGERTLVKEGHSDEVDALRRAFQAVLNRPGSDKVAEITGRDVVGFMSANHLQPDMAAEVFILDPKTAPADHGVAEAEHSEAKIAAL